MSMATLPQRSTTTPRDALLHLTERTLAYDFTVWFWGDAIAIDGLLEAADLLPDSRPLEQCLRYYKRWAKRPLGWADHLTPGLGLLRVYEATKDASLLEAARRLAQWLTEEAPRAPRSGAPLYRPDLPPYRHAVWVDTIYHEPSFLAKLAQLTGDASYYDEALNVWNSHVRVLSSERGPFLAHAFDTGYEKHRGYGWGRGNGWALYGMVDTLELLPKEHHGRQEALEYFKSLSEQILQTQDRSGFWRTLLQDREAYLESSTAAFFGGAFTRAVRLGLLDDRFAKAADLAWGAMLSRIDQDGGFYGVSACTYSAPTYSDDVSMYHTLPTEVNVWGQGSALRFAAERIRSELS
jgi:unsaturated rhamnogalacturonyl hydrolase